MLTDLRYSQDEYIVAFFLEKKKDFYRGRNLKLSIA